MTQEELLAQLRDIHIPAETTAALVIEGFALWPILAFALVLSSVLIAGYWRRTAWQRQARAALRAIEADRDITRRWSSLLTLAAQMARTAGRPDIVPGDAYQNPQTATCRALRTSARILANIAILASNYRDRLKVAI